MQKRQASDKRWQFHRDSSNISQLENSFEVLSDGKLSDISRPSLSRSSNRSTSQLSQQAIITSFGLESLPDDKFSIGDPQCDLYLEEAVNDEPEDDPTMADPPYEDHEAPRNTSRDQVNETEKFMKNVSPDIQSDDFEKEIMKIARRFNKKKRSSANPSLKKSINSSPTPSVRSSQIETSIADKKDEEKEIDPKILKGLKRIKKLDEILAEKVKLEKEAKADRKRLERNWQLEIKGFVEWCGENKSKPLIQQFLALTNGISDQRPVEDDANDIERLFQTEVETEFDESLQNTDGDSCQSKENDKKGIIEKGNSTMTSDRSTNVKEDFECTESPTEKIRNSNKKNFIRRNIALASHANEVVSLTEEEQRRLDELLADDSDLLIIDNPFSKDEDHKAPSAYELDDNARKALTDIDEQLKFLVPQSDFQSICFSPVSNGQVLTGRTGSTDFLESSKSCDVVEKYGDETLKREKNYREMQQRLQHIENELRRMSQLEEYESHADRPVITNDLLRQLIDVDSRMTSSALSIIDSARSNLDTARTEEREDIDSSINRTSQWIDTSKSLSTEKSFHDVGV